MAIAIDLRGFFLREAFLGVVVWSALVAVSSFPGIHLGLIEALVLVGPVDPGATRGVITSTPHAFSRTDDRVLDDSSGSGPGDGILLCREGRAGCCSCERLDSGGSGVCLGCLPANLDFQRRDIHGVLLRGRRRIPNRHRNVAAGIQGGASPFWFSRTDRASDGGALSFCGFCLGGSGGVDLRKTAGKYLAADAADRIASGRMWSGNLGTGLSGRAQIQTDCSAFDCCRAVWIGGGDVASGSSGNARLRPLVAVRGGRFRVPGDAACDGVGDWRIPTATIRRYPPNGGVSRRAERGGILSMRALGLDADDAVAPGCDGSTASAGGGTALLCR
jgi:hypothetical protein